MSTIIKLTHVGRLGGTSQNKGRLKFFPLKSMEDSLTELEGQFLFVNVNGSKVPFQIRSIDSQKIPFIVQLDFINSPEEARRISNSEAFMTNVQRHTPDSKFSHIINTALHSVEGTFFGNVTAVEEHPEQILLLVEDTQGQSFRIPFHEELIHNNDVKKGILTYVYDENALKTLQNMS